MPLLFDSKVLPTRFVPIAEERDAILVQLDNERTQIASIEEQINRLRTERDALLYSAAIHQDLISPMRKLSAMPEILGTIFFHCLPASGTPVVPEDAPLVLLTVCRRWHDIAMGTPQLWSDFTIPYQDSTILLDPVKIVSLWLRNVGSRPFAIHAETFRGYKASKRLGDRWEANALPAVIKRIEHCCVFDIEASFQVLKRLIPQKTRLDAKILRELKIFSFSTAIDRSDDVVVLGRIHAPKLYKLTIFRAIFVLFALSSLESLRHLSIQGWTTPTSFSQSRLVTILGSCHNLEELHLFLGSQEEEFVAHVGPRIELMFLHTLSINWDFSVDPTPLLTSVHTPALRRFLLGASVLQHRLSRNIGSSLGALFLHSTPPITHLALSNISSFSQKFGPWMSGFHELQSLDIQGGSFSRGCLAALTPGPDVETPWPCPNLTRITLYKTIIQMRRDFFPFFRRRMRQTGVPAQPDRNYLKYVNVHLENGISDAEEEEVARLESTCEDVEFLVHRFEPRCESIEL